MNVKQFTQQLNSPDNSFATTELLLTQFKSATERQRAQVLSTMRMAMIRRDLQAICGH